MSENSVSNDAQSGGRSKGGKRRNAARGASRFTRPIAFGAMALGALSAVPALASMPVANASCAAFGGFVLGSGTIGGFSTGSDCQATGGGSWAFALGEAAQAFSLGTAGNNHALAIGNGAFAASNPNKGDTKATANTIVAIGNNAWGQSAKGSNMTGFAIGDDSKVSGVGAFGGQALAFGRGASAYMTNANSNGSTNERALAIGTGSNASANDSNDGLAVAIGNLLGKSTVDGAVAVATLGDGNRAFAFGKGTGAYAQRGNDNLAIAAGDGSHALAGAGDINGTDTPYVGSRNLAIALGEQNNSFASFGNDNRAFIFGQGSTATAGSTTGSATGFSNNVATVIGNTSKAVAKAVTGATARVLGNNSNATATNNGGSATATGDNKTVNSP